MKTVLIITTYNNPQVLALSLATALQQTVLPFEIIVADDGSSSETAALIKEIREESPVPIHHCWQKNRGFRAARCRNMAIARSCADYCILIDGDIMLDEHFIEDHIRYAARRYFVQGSRVILSEEATNKIIQSKNTQVGFLDHSVGNRKNCIRSSFLAKIFSLKNCKLGGIKTCNFAFWKNDAVLVNGFNEDFVGWGQEDTEFAARLLHANICRQNIRFNALAFHLYHPIASRESLSQNDTLLLETQADKKIWCENVLNKHFGNTSIDFTEPES